MDMTDDLAQVISSFRAYETRHQWNPANPFMLACRITVPATDREVDVVWDGIALPEAIRDLWKISGELRLFEDVDYGQWGLVLFSPAEARDRTSGEMRNRPEIFHSTDVVIGEFLGDSDIFVVTESGEVFVAVWGYGRPDWFRAAPTLSQFLDGFLKALGDKYWESAPA